MFDHIKFPKIPPLNKDPRYLQFAIMLSYAFTARQFFNFERSHWITATLLSWSIILDFFLGIIFYKRWIFPLAAMINAMIASLLLDARSVYPFIFAATCALFSKCLITYNGKHIFNPGNFGVVLTLQLLPNYATGMPHLFSGHIWPSVAHAFLGLLLILWAKQVDVVLAWLGSFLLFGFFRAFLLDTSLFHIFPIVLAPSFILFTCNMITDPATNPKTRKWRIIYAVIIAFGDAVFRFLQIPYGNFYSLFLVCAFMPWIRKREECLLNTN